MVTNNYIDKNVIELNKMLLSVSWKETDFSCCALQEGNKTARLQFTEEQSRLIENLIKCIPEWKRLVDCRQHSIHDFTLDIHTLSVLKNVQAHKDYEALEEPAKLVLIYSALLHDIEKNEKEIDPEHPVKGAKKASSILYRLGFGEEFINCVYLLIRYHQIMGFILSYKVNLTEDELYNMFKNDTIVDLQAILSAADIKSVKSDGSFYGDGLDDRFEELKLKIKSLIAERNNFF